MELQIINTQTIGATKTIEASCGKTVAQVTTTGATIIVLCKNASHRAWGGMGRCFESFAEAKAAYKSGAMQAIINHAEQTI